MISGTAIAIGIGLLALAGGGIALYNGISTNNARDDAKAAQKQLQAWAGANDSKEFEAYLRDAMYMGYIDGNTYKNTMAAWTKLKNNNYNYKELDKKDAQYLTDLYNTLYKNSDGFRSQWDKQYSNMSVEDRLKFIKGAGSAGMTIPAPAYLDTDLKNYQKEVEPVKFYTNKELADIYNIDYDFESIKKDYDEAAEAAVKYANWQSDLLKNAAERGNTGNTTSYLDAIRNIKSDAIKNGMSSGARAAAELLANSEAVRNKALSEAETATKRFETINDSILKRAQTEIDTYNMYDQLAQILSTSGVGLYANDIERKGADMLANANFLSADENLRANRIAANNIMAAMQNYANAQNAQYKAQADAAWNYFNEISMPANDNDLARAMSDYIDLGYQQDTGFSNPMAKWGSGVGK